MTWGIWLFVVVALVHRTALQVVSTAHERRLRARGAVEYGAGTSRVLAALHVSFFVGAVVEGWRASASFTELTCAGLALYLLSAAVVWEVVRELGPLWTVKLYVAPDHELRRGWLLRTFRHPNYWLGLLPELLGLALVFRAWWTLGLVGAPYLVSLLRRVREEERVMGEQVEGWGR